MVMSLFVRAVWSRRLSTLALMTLLLIGSASLAAGQGVEYLSGQNIAPVFEGWERQPDRSYDFIFGYFNRNLEEHFFLPLGTENQFEPGPADRGQPTFFYPRRSWFVFRINVPADFGSQELVWTLTSNGKTETATAALGQLACVADSDRIRRDHPQYTIADSGRDLVHGRAASVAQDIRGPQFL